MNSKKLTRSTTNRKLCGVCGGLGAYFEIDPTVIRLGWAIGTIFSAGLGLAAYIAAALLVPEESSLI